MNLQAVPRVVAEPAGPTKFEQPAGNSRQILLFVLPALGVLILALCFWEGMQATDDLGYAQIAEFLLRPGEPVASVSGHHMGRAGMTWPLAFVFFLFGSSNWSLALLPLVCTVLTAPLVAIMARRFFGPGAALFAVCLYAGFPLTINLAAFYVPEPIVAFELTLASLLFLSTIENEGRRAHLLRFMAGVLVGIAYLTTEAGALMIVIFGLYLGVTGRVHFGHLSVLVGFLVVFGLELVYYTLTHGNPLFRFTLAADYVNDPMVRASNQDLTYRLLKAYPSYFIYPNLDFGAFGPLLLVGGLYGLVKFRKCSFLVIWAVIFFVFYNFMSANLNHYVALPVATRLLFPGCVPLMILAGKVLADVWQGVSVNARPRFITLASASFTVMLGALAVVSLVCMYLSSSTSLTAVIARNAETAAGYLRETPSIVLISDARSARAVQFYRQFNRQDSFVDLEAAPHVLNAYGAFSGEKQGFVMLNGPIIYEREITGSQYGGSLSLTSSTIVSQFLARADIPAFSAHLTRGPLFHALLKYRWVQGLLGQHGYPIAQNLFDGDLRFGQVQIYPYHATGGRSSGWQGAR